MPSPALVNPNYHDFDVIEIGCVDLHFFTIVNIGDIAFEINSVSIIGDNSDEFNVANENCSGTILEPAETCVFGVEFEPESLGPKIASVDIEPEND